MLECRVRAQIGLKSEKIANYQSVEHILIALNGITPKKRRQTTLQHPKAMMNQSISGDFFLESSSIS
jgi:hypothetical protein